MELDDQQWPLPPLRGATQQQNPMCSKDVPALSVIIVNYNGGERFLTCLESLFEHSGRQPIEVIVYDNASHDGTPARVAEKFPGVTLLRGTQNLGYCRAFNAAARNARAPYLLALDNDTRMLAGAVDQMRDFLDQHPEVGAVGSNLYNPDMTVQHAARRFPSALSGLFSRRGVFTRLFPRNHVSQHDLMIDCYGSGEPFEVDWHSAASLMLRRAVLDTVGGWDESYFVYWADADLCAQIRTAGYTIFNLPSAKVIHDETLAGRKGRLNPRMVIDFHRGAYRFYRKHRIRGRANPMAPIAWLGLVMRATMIIVFDRVRWQLRRFMA